MPVPPGHRRSIRHYDEPGDLHELTFSCYRRMPLLTNDRWRCLLSQSIDSAMEGQGFALAAFVFMPEHVHLLVYPTGPTSSTEDLLRAIKRPFSFRVKQLLQRSDSDLLSKLTVPDKRRGTVFCFWQKGPGYDRNLTTIDAVEASIAYIHMNPVTRGLCEAIQHWKWSSARWYLSEGRHIDDDLPTIHGIPPEFWHR